jgi:hypothetical protein
MGFIVTSISALGFFVGELIEIWGRIDGF